MSWWSRLLRRSRMEDQLERELRFRLEEHEEALKQRRHSRESAARSPACVRQSRTTEGKLP